MKYKKTRHSITIDRYVFATIDGVELSITAKVLSIEYDFYQKILKMDKYKSIIYISHRLDFQLWLM